MPHPLSVIAVFVLVSAACSSDSDGTTGPDDADTTAVELPNVAGTWIVTSRHTGTIREINVALGTTVAEASAACIVRGAGGGPLQVAVQQDGGTATVQFPTRSLACKGVDTSPATEAEDTVRLSEQFEAFAAPVQFSSTGALRFADTHNACLDDAFSQEIIVSCTWSETIRATASSNGQRLTGTFTLILDYTVVSTRRIFRITRGTWMAERIAGP